MTEIKLFKSVRIFFETMGAYSPKTKNPYHQFTNLNFLFFSSSMAIALIAMIAFLLIKATSIADYSNGFYGSTTMFCSLPLLIIFVWQMENVVKFIEHSEKLIALRCEYDAKSKIEYEKIIEKIEHFSKKCQFLLVKLTLIVIVIPSFILTYVSYYIFDLGDKSFQDLPMMLPLNTKTPLGYLCLKLLESSETFSIVSIALSAICFLVGTCWLFTLFAKDMQNNLYLLNIGGMSNENCLKRKKRLCNVVSFFSDVKGLIGDFNEIYKYVTFDIFLWTFLTVCISLFLFLVELSEEYFDLVDLISPLVFVTWSVTIIFLFCEFGEMMNGQFDAIDDVLCQCNWYLFPMELQRIVLIFMMGTQQPVFLCGFGNIECSREAFKKTVHGGFSYFMTLRQLYGY